jgi:phage repressor protein C with HTH and peptisase S24 domain
MFAIRRVVGESMAPTLREGDIVFAVRKKPRVGDIVIVNIEGREIIKRVKRVNPPALFYLVGDNPAESTDSRVFGSVSVSSLFGVVIKTFKSKK